MKYVYTLVFLILAVGLASAQKIHSVGKEYKADIKVYVVDKEYKADLLVYKVDTEYKAKDNQGKWVFTEKEYNADKKIFFVDREYKADLKVYFVDSDYKAGWKKKRNNIYCIENLVFNSRAVFIPGCFLFGNRQRVFLTVCFLGLWGKNQTDN